MKVKDLILALGQHGPNLEVVLVDLDGANDKRTKIQVFEHKTKSDSEHKIIISGMN